MPGMVISRTTNTLKDGTKRWIVYYACGAWKNKGTAVCHSNSIRVEKANAVVFYELEKIFTNEKFLKMILEKVNEERQRQSARTKKDCAKAEKELQKYEKRRKKVFEAYEDGMINGEEFLKRKSEIAEETEQLQKKIKESALLTGQEKQREIPYELVRDILQNFSKVLNSEGIERGLKKQLLHMLISEITIDKKREIESIHIRLTGELVQFLQNTGGISIRGVPPDFLCGKIGIPAFYLEFAI